VGCDNDVVHAPQGMVFGEGFHFEDVETGTGEFAIFEGDGEGFEVYNFATTNVDEHGTLFHCGNGGAVDHVGGFVGVRHADGDEVGFGEHLVEVFGSVDVFDIVGGAFGSGVYGKHAHAKGVGALGHSEANTTEAHDAHCGVAEKDHWHVVILPTGCVLATGKDVGTSGK